MHASKHLVNKREDSVQDSINGFVYTNNQNLFTLTDYPNVVVRKDYLSLIKDKKVALLSGGGSGHEPSHTGFIGKGMLTAVSCGNIFASPSPASILAALRAIGTNNEAGVLMIVKNYTGDRLNFGIAAKRAQLEGIRVEYVLVNDDVALLNNNQLDEESAVGRRGLAGTLFIHKLAGALAEQNKSLDEIKQAIDDVLNNHLLRTVGVSLSGGVDLPQKSVIVKNNDELQNTLEYDHIEIGLGIHGEAGKRRIKLEKCYDLVETLFHNLELNDQESKLDICLLVNNLGSLSNFELSLLVNDCCKYVLNERKNYNIRRLYSGTLMTALDMTGFSITLLIVKHSGILELLDFETNAYSWPKLCGVDLNQHFDDPRVKSATLRTPSARVKTEETRYYNFNGSVKLQKLLYNCIKAICHDLIDLKEYLNELDTFCGDGDSGNSLEIIANKVLDSLDEPKCFNFNFPHQVLTNVSYLIEQCGGTLSAIFSLGTAAAAQAFLLRSDESSDNDDERFWFKIWYLAINNAIKAIQEYGGAKPNQRSLLDPLFHVDAYFKEKIGEVGKLVINEIVKEFVNISYESAHETAKMVPKVGRASYIDPKLINKPDAGAFAASSMFSSIYKIFLKENL
jgi:dihydroxyacetone kinase